VWGEIAKDAEADKDGADEVEDRTTIPLWILAVRGGAGGKVFTPTDDADQDGDDAKGKGDISEKVDVHGGLRVENSDLRRIVPR
jgi:hypothetical protein